MIEVPKKRIAVFASGGGSNAEQIFAHFKDHKIIEVALCLYNRIDAGVVSHCNTFGIPNFYFSNESIAEGCEVYDALLKNEIDFIVLAGFLKKIPQQLISPFQDKIINIHPALLPKFGGKGMYGMNVHKAVRIANETTSGPTIHLVNEKYDDGKILAQFETTIAPHDSPEKIQEKVLKLEHQYFSKVIETYILEQSV